MHIRIIHCILENKYRTLVYISKNMATVIFVWYHLKFGLNRSFSGHLQVEYVNRSIILDVIVQSETIIHSIRIGISNRISLMLSIKKFNCLYMTYHIDKLKNIPAFCRRFFYSVLLLVQLWNFYLDFL